MSLFLYFWHCKYFFPVCHFSFDFAYSGFVMQIFSLIFFYVVTNSSIFSFTPSGFWVIERLSLYAVYKCIHSCFILVFVWLHFFPLIFLFISPFLKVFLQLDPWPIWSLFFCTVCNMNPIFSRWLSSCPLIKNLY